LLRANFRNTIVRGILRRVASFDIVRTQDISQISGRDDVAVLEYATAEDRVVVTHDVSTMIPAMHEQIRLASRCAPIVFMPDSLPIIAAVDDMILLDECGLDTDWAAGVLYLPLR